MTSEKKNFCSFGRIRAAAKFSDGHVAAIKAVHGHLDRNPERYPVVAYFWTESTDPERPGYEPQALYGLEAVENMMADVASGAFAPKAGYRAGAAVPAPSAKAPLTAAEKAAAAEAEEVAAKAALEQAEKALEQARARLKDAQSAAVLARADAEKVAAEAAEKALTAAKAAAASLSATDLAALLKEARAAEKAAAKTE